MNRTRLTVALACAAALAAARPAAAQGGDAEAATHENEAASPQASFEERIGGAVLRQYQLGCLSHLSYLVGSQGVGLVVDPQRDVDHYLRDAQALGLSIRYVLLTHMHADFVAGHTELARRTGATILAGALSGAEFPHQATKDGDRVTIGAATLEVWHTPGHAPDHTSGLLHVPGAAAAPAYAFTGDSLFIGSVGRPDLREVPPAKLASQGFDTMQRFKALPDATKVLPAHGAGTLCGAHLSPDTVSTIGREKATNPFLREESRAAYVARVVHVQPVIPQYFRHNVQLNRQGPPVVAWSEDMPRPLPPAAAKAELEQGAWLVDLRDQRAYALGHVQGSVNVAVRGRLDTWTGIVVPWGARLVLVGSDGEVKEGAFRFKRIGYDQVAGYLAGGVEAWRAAGLAVRTTRLVSPEELAGLIAARREPLVIDVRTPEEYAEVRLGDYGNIPVTEAERLGVALDKDAPVLLACNSAYRSSMAVGLAERQGFKDVWNLDGGLDAWLAAGLPTVGSAPVCAAPPAPPAVVTGGPVAAPVPIVLPEPIDAEALALGLMDQPRAYAVLDVRPRWQFEEYHVPGARSVAPEAVADVVRELPAGVRPVVVDRDGTTAFAVAGAALARLGGEGARPLRVLLGGVARYHRAIELERGGPVVQERGQVSPVPATPVPAAPAPATPASPTAPVRRRSAGC